MLQDLINEKHFDTWPISMQRRLGKNTCLRLFLRKLVQSRLDSRAAHTAVISHMMAWSFSTLEWMNFNKKLETDEVKIAKMWLVLILGVAAVVVEGRQFTREPTDTTTTVGDKAVLRFWIPNAFGNIWMSWKSGVGSTPLPPGRCSGRRMDLPWGWIGACLAGQTTQCSRTRREHQVSLLGSCFTKYRKSFFSRHALAKMYQILMKSILLNLASHIKIFFAKDHQLTTNVAWCHHQITRHIGLQGKIIPTKFSCLFRPSLAWIWFLVSWMYSLWIFQHYITCLQPLWSDKIFLVALRVAIAHQHSLNILSIVLCEAKTLLSIHIPIWLF